MLLHDADAVEVVGDLLLYSLDELEAIAMERRDLDAAGGEMEESLQDKRVSRDVHQSRHARGDGRG